MAFFLKIPGTKTFLGTDHVMLFRDVSIRVFCELAAAFTIKSSSPDIKCKVDAKPFSLKNFFYTPYCALHPCKADRHLQNQDIAKHGTAYHR